MKRIKTLKEKVLYKEMSGKRGNNQEKYTEEQFNERENNPMGKNRKWRIC